MFLSIPLYFFQPMVCLPFPSIGLLPSEIVYSMLLDSTPCYYSCALSAGTRCNLPLAIGCQWWTRRIDIYIRDDFDYYNCQVEQKLGSGAGAISVSSFFQLSIPPPPPCELCQSTRSALLHRPPSQPDRKFPPYLVIAHANSCFFLDLPLET